MVRPLNLPASDRCGQRRCGRRCKEPAGLVEVVLLDMLGQDLWPVEEHRAASRRLDIVGPSHKGEEARAERDGDAEDDALTDSVDVVLQAVHSGVEENVVCLLEGGKHQHTLVHLRNAEPRDAQHLAAGGHQVREDREVAPVDRHAVRRDRLANLGDDRGPRSLDAQGALDVEDVVGRDPRAQHTAGAHDVEQVVALGQHLEHRAALLVDLLHHRAADAVDAPDDNVWQLGLELLQHKVRVALALARRGHGNLVAAHDPHVLALELELAAALQDGGLDGVHVDLELQLVHARHVQLDEHIAARRRQHLLDVVHDLAQQRLLDAALDDLRGHGRAARLQHGRDDRRARVLDRVDDFLDAGHAEGDVHAGNAREVEGLQRHLRGRLAETLAADGTDGRAGLDARALVLVAARLAEELQLRLGQPEDLLDCLGNGRLLPGWQRADAVVRRAEAGHAHARAQAGQERRLLVQEVAQLRDEDVLGGLGGALAVEEREHRRADDVSVGLLDLIRQQALLAVARRRVDDVSKGVIPLDRCAVALHLDGVQAVITVAELNDSANGGADRQIVVCREVLEGLHQTTLHVARLGGLDGRVDEALAAAHGVEEELRRRQPRVEAVANEALGGRMAVQTPEVRQRALLEAVGDTRPANRLLADTRNHLREVQKRALGATLGHDQRGVGAGQIAIAGLARGLTNRVELLRHDVLKRLLGITARLRLQLAGLVLLDEVLALLVARTHKALLGLEQRRAGPHVRDADGEAAVHEEERGDLGQARHGVGGGLLAAVAQQHVEDGRLAAAAQDALVEHAAEQL
eukprot:m.10081 g.10081  ORF g.10081 m.10081 type:complete len:806 (-) comp2487_c0_seq1:1984-4401(-)